MTSERGDDVIRLILDDGGNCLQTTTERTYRASVREVSRWRGLYLPRGFHRRKEAVQGGHYHATVVWSYGFVTTLLSCDETMSRDAGYGVLPPPYTIHGEFVGGFLKRVLLTFLRVKLDMGKPDMDMRKPERLD